MVRIARRSFSYSFLPCHPLLKMALFLFFYLLAVLTLASGKPILIPRQAGEATQDVAQTSFDVAIETLGNTTVRAEITNLGSEGVRLSQRGGILDHVPTKKVIVQGGG